VLTGRVLTMRETLWPGFPARIISCAHLRVDDPSAWPRSDTCLVSRLTYSCRPQHAEGRRGTALTHSFGESAMEFLIQLWLPIILSAVFLFVVSSVIHMATPLHKGDYRKLKNEDAVLEGLRAHGVEPGECMFPCAGSMNDMNSPEMTEKRKRGPVGFLTIMPSGEGNIGRSLVWWLSSDCSSECSPPTSPGMRWCRRALSPGLPYRRYGGHPGLRRRLLPRLHLERRTTEHDREVHPRRRHLRPRDRRNLRLALAGCPLRLRRRGRSPVPQISNEPNSSRRTVGLVFRSREPLILVGSAGFRPRRRRAIMQ